MELLLNHKPTVSVIIPCHNNVESLEIALLALKAQTSLPEEIICVDDSSDDAKLSYITSLTRTYNAKLVRLHSTPTHIGRRSMARNAGARVARGDVLLFLDGDMVLGSQYIQALRILHSLDQRIMVKGIRYAISKEEQQKGIGHCLHTVFDGRGSAPMIQDIYRVSQYSKNTVLSDSTTAWATLGFSLMLSNPNLSRRGFLKAAGLTLLASLIGGDAGSPISLPYSTRWDYCASNNLSIRRSEVERIGYWDEKFIGWGEEDIDFAYRLFKSGCRPVIPESGPIYAYHLDHDIDIESNLSSLGACPSKPFK